MLVRFETKTYPPITMFGDVATKLLRLMRMSGDVPGAIEGRDVGEALAQLRAGLARLEPGAGEASLQDDGDREDGDDKEPEIGLTVRAFPLLELLSLASENGHHVVWTQKEPMYRSQARDPSPGHPTDPSTVLAREDLAFEDKVALLKDWQPHLTERMTATDENMGGPQNEGQLAEQLRHVSRALSILQREAPGT